jgi:hypothetical protein
MAMCYICNKSPRLPKVPATENRLRDVNGTRVVRGLAPTSFNSQACAEHQKPNERVQNLHGWRLIPWRLGRRPGASEWSCLAGKRTRRRHPAAAGPGVAPASGIEQLAPSLHGAVRRWQCIAGGRSRPIPGRRGDCLQAGRRASACSAGCRTRWIRHSTLGRSSSDAVRRGVDGPPGTDAPESAAVACATAGWPVASPGGAPGHGAGHDTRRRLPTPRPIPPPGRPSRLLSTTLPDSKYNNPLLHIVHCTLRAIYCPQTLRRKALVPFNSRRFYSGAIDIMPADAGSPLTKVDSAVQGLSSSPTKDKERPGHRRGSSSATGVYNIADLGVSLFRQPGPSRGHRNARLPQSLIRPVADGSDRKGRQRTYHCEGDAKAKLVWNLPLTVVSLDQPAGEWLIGVHG